ncbi:MAG TPA: TIR domain-containing protein [Azoarcus taiwanensis]|nr:TIR domain-containing protein [Azoarcus taiwanensis]
MVCDRALFDVFFSYHWRDHASVEAIALTLADRGLRIFLDRWYLAPGQPWPQALEHALASCNAVAVFVGGDGLGPWQQRERDLALDRQSREPDFPVIPVLLTRTDPALGFLKLNTWVDLSQDISDERILEALCAAIRRQALAPEDRLNAAAFRADVCPYRGLRPFREEDAEFFFGRETYTGKLIEAVEHTALVTVVGASGSGKSSVVRAGLIPRLRRTKAGRVWEIITMVPTDRPLHSLAAALLPYLEPHMTHVDRLGEINKLADHLLHGAVALRDVVEAVLNAQPGTERLLLFVDQWEELYTLVADDAVRRRFIAEVLDASANASVTVVLTLRGDFFGHALADRSFADRLEEGQINLGPMTTEELRRSIVAPAELMQLRFEPGLVDRILDDVGQEPGNLPLLEFVLAGLWEQRQGNTLKHEVYDRMGGVDGAIAARADAEFARFDAAEKIAARRYLLQLVKPGDETDDVRQRASLPVRDATVLKVVRRLADARLVVTGWDAMTGAETVEVTHEALIRNWTLLREWIDQDREFLRGKARIDAAATLWEKDRRDASRLLRAGHPLAEGEALLARSGEELRAETIAFIEASMAATARTRRRTWFARAAISAVVLAVVVGAGAYWDLRVRKHVEYSNAYLKRWGVLEPFAPVGAVDVAQRSRTLLFERQGRHGPVIRVRAMDGSGTCARVGLQDPVSGIGLNMFGSDDATRPCTLVWQYDRQNRVERQIMLDTRDRILATLLYKDQQRTRAEFISEHGDRVPTGLTTIAFERIEDGPHRGQDRFERYRDAAGKPKAFMNAFAARIEYDRRGLIARIVSLGRNDEPVRNSGGFADLRITYDGTGSPVEIAVFDEQGIAVIDKSGAARRTIAYDTRGNASEETYYDDEGRPTPIKAGYARIIVAYGARGEELSRAYFDERGNATLHKNGYARVVRRFDGHGRPVEEAYLDEAGQPTLSKDGYAKVAMSYDEVTGDQVSASYFDEAGEPVRGKKGYAKVVRAFDDRGRLVEESYRDGAGQPTRSSDGCARRTLIYDARGLPIEVDCSDEAGDPALSVDGYARTKRSYDAAGNRIREAYFDETGRPTLSRDGYAMLVRGYDDDNRHVSEAYFDEAGQPIANEFGFARVGFIHDDRGNMIQRDYYDERGNPALSKSRCARLTRAYDAGGNVTEEAFFDPNGEPCANSLGVAKAVMRYDRYGNRIEQAHYDQAGKPTRSSEGVAVMKSTYDLRGNMIDQAYFDEHGKPTLSIHHYARVSKVYDARGNAVAEAYFDADGNPTTLPQGYAQVIVAYDARGNPIESQYLDGHARPTRGTHGYAILRQTYDDRDRLTGQAFLDENGSPVRSNDGYARATMAYDERGFVIEQAYFDENGTEVRKNDRAR